MRCKLPARASDCSSALAQGLSSTSPARAAPASRPAERVAAGARRSAAAPPTFVDPLQVVDQQRERLPRREAAHQRHGGVEQALAVAALAVWPREQRRGLRERVGRDTAVGTPRSASSHMPYGRTISAWKQRPRITR